MAHPNLRPRPNPSKAPFPFLALPTELRLQIYSYLSVLTNYAYIHRDPPPQRQYPLRCHGMLLASHQLHAEYAQAFYERTSFLFNIDANNGTRPAFWTLPPALLPNLRRCKLYVEVGELTRVPGFSMEAFVARIEALLRRMERVRWVNIVWDIREMIGLLGWGDDEWLRKEGLWEQLMERFVRYLKGRSRMQAITVQVGRRVLRWERKGAEWGVVPY